MSKRRVISQSLKVDQLNQDIWIFFGVAIFVELFLDILNLSDDDLFLGGFVFGLSDCLD